MRELVLFKNNKLNKKELANFLRQLSFLLESKINIKHALKILLASQDFNKSLILKKILININQDILSGESISKSFAKHKEIPKLIINLIKSGEHSSDLDKIILRLANYYEQEINFQDSFNRAMIYPSIICLAMILILILSLNFILPSYNQIFLETQTKLPKLTLLILNLNSFINKYYLILISLALSFYFLIYKKFIISSNYFIKLINQIKLSSRFYKLRLNFMISQVFFILLSSNIKIISCVSSLKEIINNKILDHDFDLIINNLNSGESLSSSFNKSKNLKLDYFLISMINIGEESGDLKNIFFYCEKYFASQLKNYLAKLEKLIEPVMTIIIGLLLAIIMLAILEPTLDLNNLI
jgi:type IV pilus assembly protein PilC